MKETKTALLVILSVLVFFALCFGIIYLSQLTPEDDYYQKTGWNCSKETFTEDYFALYTQKLDHLKTKYALTCETLYDSPTEEEGEKIELALYCPQYTLYFSLVNSGEIGFCNTKLYYYGDDEEQLLSLLALLTTLPIMSGMAPSRKKTALFLSAKRLQAKKMAMQTGLCTSITSSGMCNTSPIFPMKAAIITYTAKTLLKKSFAPVMNLLVS